MAAAALRLITAWKELDQAMELSLKSLDETFEEGVVLGTLGWTFPISATLSECKKLLKLSTDIRSADDAFSCYYTKNDGIRLKALEHKLLESRNLQRWKPSLEEAILNLHDGRHRSCIALLLPLVEGVTAINFSAPQIQKKTERDRFFRDKLAAVRPGSVSKFVWRSYKGFAEVLFQQIDFDGPLSKPPLLNRHYLLHGRGISEGNLSDCLRLLQALDTIIADCLPNASELLKLLDHVRDAVESGGRVLTRTPLRCFVCGEGKYAELDPSTQDFFSFGFRNQEITGGNKFKLLRFSNCGHAQLFMFRDGVTPAAWAKGGSK
jgi:SAM-dependent methyltransferase